MSSERAELVERILNGSRALSTETVMFHTAIAERSGLSAVESKVADYLARFGPQTPKALSQLSGLAPASITALIDRLESKGIVARKPHPEDRRKVLIEIDGAMMAGAAPLWDHLVKSVREACEKYTDSELETVIRFLGDATTITNESTGLITQRNR
ncbi:MarR family winged helix-turn-helix transcriptional regulator [Amycolatopsis sp. BJA-103]|uniref:MarR family winged helix-turn-helix transcriptional regulator n=1 Tax=unclassified Amycolatopsis TaxID=2618356 RepID=UPI000C77ED70|nr:MarR family transcriptional regulator [Amycolatopsis sp. BJA-103]AUI62488.1 MarR family transcriptional regulator [Amycolatopsis sp. BJA-103]PNE18324.1 MarR family transcriptional regulator [Amycolatopsis sp. BJA-103]